jgi:hypothetical protein
MKEFCILLDMGIVHKFLNCVYCDFNKRNVTSHCVGSMFTTIYCYAVCCYFLLNYTEMCDKLLVQHNLKLLKEVKRIYNIAL